MSDRPINFNSLQNHSSSNEPTHSTVKIPKYNTVAPSLPETADNETKPDHSVAAEQTILNHGEDLEHIHPQNKSSTETTAEVKP